MRQKIKHLLENVIEEILVGTLIVGCAIGSIAKEIKIRQPVPIERKLSEFRQGEIPGISEGDEFLLESVYKNKTKNLKQKEITSKDLELLTQMIHFEAGVCATKEKIAIGYTSINRLKNGDYKNLEEVIRKPFQYSCFNDLDNEEMICGIKTAKERNRDTWTECEDIARKIVQGEYPDPTNGATHYYNPKIVKNLKWNMGNLEKIGRIKTEKGNSRHIFFREKYEEIVSGGS